jgi:hypothetical protein
MRYILQKFALRMQIDFSWLKIVSMIMNAILIIHDHIQYYDL